MKLSRHELRELRRERRKEDRKDEEDKQSKSRRQKKLLIYVIGVMVVLGIGFGAYSLSTNGNSINIDTTNYIQSQLSAIPSSFVHWHADVDVFVCGEERRLPEALLGGLLGTGSLHTHDSSTNGQSFRNSDGNGIIHNEGNIHNYPIEQTLGKFFELMGIPFSENGIFDVKNGDSCPDGSPGKLKVFVNDQEMQTHEFLFYIPRDGDRIKISFEALGEGESLG